MKDKYEKGYHKLLVWQKLKDLLVTTYSFLEKLPHSEEFGLKSQMKRAVVSVLSNFVEGYLKKSTKQKLHFLEIAESSLFELESQAEACFILNFWDDKDYESFESKRRFAAYFLYRYKSKLETNPIEASKPNRSS